MRDLSKEERWGLANEIADFINEDGVRVGMQDALKLIDRLVESEEWAEL